MGCEIPWPSTNCRPREFKGERAELSLRRSPLFCFSSDLKIFRPRRPCTRDSFSHARPSSVRKSLIFLRLHTAAPPAPSDNGQSVKFRRGGAVLGGWESRAARWGASR